MAATVQKSSITLKGSADILCEYLNFGINSILFQRGLYPPEKFENSENYGLTILMSTDKQIKDFLDNTFKQLKDWLAAKRVNKVALIITNVKTLETMERWDFVVEYEEGKVDENGETISEKPLKQIRKEIREVLIQITSSVTYLPLLDCLCSFDIQIYTKPDVDIPKEWSEAEPANIKNAQCVKMKSFSTDLHRLGTVVTYKMED